MRQLPIGFFQLSVVVTSPNGFEKARQLACYLLTRAYARLSVFTVLEVRVGAKAFGAVRARTRSGRVKALIRGQAASSSHSTTHRALLFVSFPVSILLYVQGHLLKR